MNEAQVEARVRELQAMTLVELTAIHNGFTGKSVKKLKKAKDTVVGEILFHELKAERERAEREAAEQVADAPKPKRVSARSHLRALFPSVGERKRADAVISELEAMGAKRSTIATTISDLKRPELAGKAGPLVLERDGDFLQRVA